MSVYRVTNRRSYRGHPRGTTFEATLDPLAEQRALTRGDIKVLQRTIPAVQPGTYTFPAGWLNDNGGG